MSLATASRAINGSGYVRDQARAAVLRAAEELGYVGHGPARALASRRTKLIGAIVPTIDNPVFARCLDALQAELDAAGLSLLLATSGYDRARELVGIRTLLERGVDGLVLVGRTRAESTYRMIGARRVPICLVWSTAADPAHDFVGFDNREPMARLVEHLHGLGHRRFGMIAGCAQDNDRAADRIEGVRAALRKRALDCPVLERPYTVAAGQDAADALMRGRDPPTAILCGNDLLAFGALSRCKALGLTVPRDVSVTGFDDLEIASCSTPPLTTVQVAAGEIGRRAAELLVRRIGGARSPLSCLIESQLVLRGSTAPPPS